MKLENRRLSCQSFSEILRILEQIWSETHHNLRYSSGIEGASLKFKNQKRFIFRPRPYIQTKKLAQKSHATVSLTTHPCKGDLGKNEEDSSVRVSICLKNKACQTNTELSNEDTLHSTLFTITSAMGLQF
jgi:hypothetical protein